MIRSMTGYGKGERELPQGTLSIEVRSVNSRYFDFSIRFPETLEALEEEIKRLFSQRLVRGRVKVYITLNGNADDKQNVQLNREKAGHYRKLLSEAMAFTDSPEPVTLSHLLNVADIFDVQTPESDPVAIKAELFTLIDEVLAQVFEMQTQEGAHLAEDIDQHIEIIAKLAETIRTLSAENKKSHFMKLKEKLRLLAEDLSIDDDRLVQEAALHSKKIDITEECERLKSHLKQFNSYLRSNEPVGKRMTFLLQEMNREISTIGAKSENVAISHHVVEIKNELEKIREQAQNIV